MNENLIPECREFTMVEELWPIKKYDGATLIYDCREWLVEIIQQEILDHIKNCSYPYLLTFSDAPIMSEECFKRTPKDLRLPAMQKLSPVEVAKIVTPFMKKGYHVYQDEAGQCIKISRKEIKGLCPIDLPKL